MICNAYFYDFLRVLKYHGALSLTPFAKLNASLFVSDVGADLFGWPAFRAQWAESNESVPADQRLYLCLQNTKYETRSLGAGRTVSVVIKNISPTPLFVEKMRFTFHNNQMWTEDVIFQSTLESGEGLTRVLLHVPADNYEAELKFILAPVRMKILFKSVPTLHARQAPRNAYFPFLAVIDGNLGELPTC